MEELMDLMVSDEPSSAQISDKIKDILFSKTADKVAEMRPKVAASIFDQSVDLDTDEPVGEIDQDVDLDSEQGSEEEE
tara:strand:+ start:718 stop:951 length:234 start_codon:yes stop_codon:yes gene_type:complete